MDEKQGPEPCVITAYFAWDEIMEEYALYLGRDIPPCLENLMFDDWVEITVRRYNFQP